MKYFLVLSLMILSSRNLPAQDEVDWETYFEKSGYASTATYEQTMHYFQNLADYSEFAEFHSFGLSPQLRELNYLLVSREKKKNTQMNDSSEVGKLFKPAVLIINGIHSGEIEGKDASMILLREILVTKEKEYLLDSLNLIVVPIFNVDGHERKSKYNRINQNGPEEMGWRTTSQNLNLNRDWMKADAPEMQAMLKLINRYLPDFAIDTHTTDGADYQYTLTYSVEKHANIFSGTAEWLKSKFIPFLEAEISKQGYLIHPYVYLKNWRKGLDDGLIEWASSPRLSTGYFALRNRPSLLVETHMIKPYKERVYSTKSILETTLQFLFSNLSELRELNFSADEQSINLYDQGKYIPLFFSVSDVYETRNFKGYEYYWDSSAISGKEKLIYTDKKKDLAIKHYSDLVAADLVKVARGYYITPEYSYLVDKIKLHGINPALLISKSRTDLVTRYKFKNIKFAENSYEGRQLVTFEYDTYSEVVNIPEGSYLFLTDHANARLLTHLLEPKSPDSFVRLGFMNHIFERKEYYEDYVMEEIAEEMLANDPELKKHFETKLKNEEEFRNDPRARLDFFYERSPYFDKQKNLYPILRIAE